MFGKQPFSSASYAGSSNNVYTQALTYLSTSTVTIVKQLQRLFSITSTSAVTIARVVAHLLSLTYNSVSSTTIIKSLIRTLSVTSTSTVSIVKAIVKYMALITEVTIDLLYEKASHFLTLSVVSTSTATIARIASHFLTLVYNSVSSTTLTKLVQYLRSLTVISTSTSTSSYVFSPKCLYKTTSGSSIYSLNVPPGFIDAGENFMGDCQNIIQYIENIILQNMK